MSEKLRAKEYHRSKEFLFLANIALTFAFLATVQFSGLSTFFKIVSGDNNALYLCFFFNLLTFVFLPINFYSSYVLEKKFNLSNQALGHWIGDELKKYALSFLFFILTGEFFLYIVRAFPETWWLWAGAGWLFLTLFLARVLPKLIIPLFYKVRELTDEVLKHRLFHLCEKAGVRLLRIEEILFSKKTKKANAALIGLGGGRRILLSDTLLQKFTPDEIEMVIAHEIGHHVKKHILRSFIFNFILTLFGFYLLNLFSMRIVHFFAADSLADLSIFPTLVFLSVLGSLLILPIQSAFSRAQENEADDYALSVVPTKSIFVSLMNKLAQQNLADPEPPRWVELLLHDHPSVPRRIARATQRVLIAMLFLYNFMVFQNPPLHADEFPRTQAKISRVIDGDTVILKTGEHVRLIGINSPEYAPWKHKIQPYGKEAKECAQTLLDQKTVFLESDIEKKDKYQRTLAYLYLESGELANLKLVQQGCARAGYYAPNGRYYRLLKEAERQAKSEHIGMWQRKNA